MLDGQAELQHDCESLLIEQHQQSLGEPLTVQQLLQLVGFVDPLQSHC